MKALLLPFAIIITFGLSGLVAAAEKAPSQSSFCKSKYDFQIVPGGQVLPFGNLDEVCRHFEVLDKMLEVKTRELTSCFETQVRVRRSMGHYTPYILPVTFGWNGGKVRMLYPLRIQLLQRGIGANATLEYQDQLRLCVENVIESIQVSPRLRSTMFAGTFNFSQ